MRDSERNNFLKVDINKQADDIINKASPVGMNINTIEGREGIARQVQDFIKGSEVQPNSALQDIPTFKAFLTK